MSTIEYAVRDAGGLAQRGSFSEGVSSTIYVASSKDVSLNVRPDTVQAFHQIGNDLHVILVNGQVLILDGYFDESITGKKNLFVSEGGQLHAVQLSNDGDETLLFSFDSIDVAGKWSAFDDMVFLDIELVEPVVAPLVAPFLGGLGGLAAGGAALAGAAVLTGGGGGDDGGGGPVVPTVDDVTVDRIVGGSGPDSVTITGTGEPNATVVVTIGTETQTTTVDQNGTWTATFDPADLPDDGVYVVDVVVTDPNGTETPLVGPSVDIDTTAPDVTITSGTQSTGDMVNAEEHQAGTIIAGTGEADATVSVEINGTTHTTTVAADGTWSVTFTNTELATGEYNELITVTSTDARGNSTAITDNLVVDTVAPISEISTVAGDDIINAAEANGEITISGTGEPGSTLLVEFAGESETITVAADGSWSTGFAGSAVASGTYESTVTVTSTDAAGNSSSTSHIVNVDTENTLGLDAPIAGDNIINGAEAGSGVTLTGTAEPNAQVAVTLEGVTHTVTADTNGAWSTTYTTSEIAAGEYDARITVETTDAAGNPETIETTVRVDTDISASLDAPIAGDNIINATEAAAGVTLTGLAQAGSEVEVTLQGVSHTVTAGADGKWSSLFTAAEIPGGEYIADVSVTARDAAGNTATTTATVRVDTQMELALDGPIAGDNIINAAEATAGVTLTGTAQAGEMVEVTLEGVKHSVKAGSDGKWSSVFTTAEIPAGEYDATISVTSTDAAGNTETVNGTVRVDTSTSVTLDAPVAGDNIINASEATAGVTLTGTAQAGSEVEVTLEGVSHTVTAGSDGKWSSLFTTAEIPAGEYESAFSVTSTDAAGNSATVDGTVQVDTATTVTLDGPVAGDNIINASEATAGVTLTGTAQAGSEVKVTLQGVAHTVTAGSNGQWSSVFTTAEIPVGEYDATISVTSKDAAGNTAKVDGTVRVDTQINVTLNAPVAGDNIINATEATAGVTLAGTAQAGAEVEVTLQGVKHTVTAGSNGQWSSLFTTAEIPAGEYDAAISVASTDAAGNTATATGTVRVDTQTNVTIDGTQAGDNIINATESQNGVTLTGTAQPNAQVEVSFEGVKHTVTANSTGQWSSLFNSSEIPSGEYTATISAKATDAAGNTATTDGSIKVDTVTTVTVNDGIAGDDIVNADESAAGITLNGTAEPGSAVTVTIVGVTRTATVDTNGNWTAVFEGGSLPAGEFDAKVTVNATDLVGNKDSSSTDLRIDTIAGEVALSQSPIEIDDVINFEERADGVVISGIATPGLTVTVGLGEASHQVVAGPSGAWSSLFLASEIPTGTKTLPITASITDSAGNFKSVSDTVKLDTQVDNNTISDTPVETDDVINLDERANGVTLTGTTEVGSSVMVQLGSATRPATVDNTGNWTVTFPASDIPLGESSADITAVATDEAGNVSTLHDTVAIDTLVSNFATDPNQTADDAINAEEMTNGVTLSGTTEPNSTISVELEGITQSATVDANGNWTVTFAPGSLPMGTYDTTAVVTAKDEAGNVEILTESFHVDTYIDTPDVDAITFSGADVRRLSTTGTFDNFSVNTLTADGDIGDPTYTTDTDPTFGTEFTFASPVSDGTHLVVNAVDDAGNRSSTLLVLQDNATNAGIVDNAGLAQFDIHALNLDYAVDTNLSLTEAQVQALSGSSDTLTIHGSADDTVTLTGASLSAETRLIDGHTYDVYTFGTGETTLIIEHDINVII